MSFPEYKTEFSQRIMFSLPALLTSLHGAVPRERFQDPVIRQNGNGSYYIRPWIDKITEDGIKRLKKVIVLGSVDIGKRGAMSAKRKVMETINRASYVVQSQVKFSFLLDEYEKRHLSRQAISSQKKCECLLRRHIRPAFGHLQLCEITGNRVQEWLDAKEAAGMSWGARADLRGLMSSAFSRAKKWKYWDDDNPIQYVALGRMKLQREKRKLTDDQVRKLLAALPSQVRTIACVALFCGLRVSEILGLQERHFDFVNGLISVQQRCWRGDIDTVKTRNSERVVPMGHLASEIKLLCLGDLNRYVFHVTKILPGNRVCVCKDSTNLSTAYLRPAAKATGCYWVGFGWHSLRREAITAFNADLGVTQAMRLGGHSSASMSAEYTLSDHIEQDRAIRARQERLMGEVKGKPV
jgi:integrase